MYAQPVGDASNNDTRCVCVQERRLDNESKAELAVRVYDENERES